MSVLKITAANGREYFPEYQSNKITRTSVVGVVSLLDFDGEYLNKRKSSGRTHSLVVFFQDENTANQFEDDTCDTRPIMFFDPVYNTAAKAHILSLEWSHEYTNNIDIFAFNLTLQETTARPAHTESQNLPTIAQFNRRTEDVNLPSGFNSFFDRAAGILEEIIDFTANIFRRASSDATDISGKIENIRLRIESLKKTGASTSGISSQKTAEFRQIINLLKIVSLIPFEQVNTLRSSGRPLNISQRQQILNVLDGYSKIMESCETLKNPELGNELYYTVIAPMVFCKCGILSSLSPETETRRFFSQVQKNLYNDYEKLINTTSADRVSTPDKSAAFGHDCIEYLTLAITEIEENYLRALQERTIVLDAPTDIYPLVSRLYPSTNPQDFEVAFSRFIEDNKIHGEELFMLPVGKKITYCV